MKILLLAPHPFYQERGTPIAVDLLLRFWSGRGDTVDVVTFHEGSDRAYRGVTIMRIPRPGWIKNVPPGFSLRKVVCDAFLFWKAMRLAARGGYGLVHAVEESVFCAMLIKRLYRLPYVYDMDSSLPMQLIEKSAALAPAGPALRFCERAAVRGALAVVAVCDALAAIARAAGAKQVFVLRDVSLLPETTAPAAAPGEAARLPAVEHPCFMYIGNLEAYQGIGLLLESFAILCRDRPESFLAVIGGSAALIARYRKMSAEFGIAGRVRFFGPRPLADMPKLFAEADALVSPRTKGSNTPMKIYSYLQSGKPVIATALPTHTQVLDETTALLAEPRPERFAAAMRHLLENPGEGKKLADKAAALAAAQYSHRAYGAAAAEIFNRIESELQHARDN